MSAQVVDISSLPIVGPSDIQSGDSACVDTAVAGLIGLRLGGLFGILGISTIGVLIPFFTYKVKFNTIYFLLKAFASGVVLATGYVHVLGDAASTWSDPCLYTGTYPWAMAIALAASIITFTLEWSLQIYFKQVIYKNVGTELGIEDNQKLQMQEDKLENAARASTFEIGIIFHSVFVGITLGLTQNPSTVVSLMIALMFHQGCEGIALGVLFVKAGFSTFKYMVFAMAFLVVMPIGIAIGIGLNTTYNKKSKLALAFEGVFDSVSAGILIYNGLVDLIIPTFDVKELPKKKWLQALGFLSLYFGVFIMALIGKWA